MERLYEYTKIIDLKDMLKKSRQKYGKNIAYKIRESEGKYKIITHEQARQMIDGLGTALIDMGLKDKRIAVIGENRYEWEIAYLSIVCGTGIVVPLDKSLPEKELESLINRSEVEAIICSEKYIETLKKIKNQKIENQKIENQRLENQKIENQKFKYIISMDSEKADDEVISQKQLIEKGMKLVEKGDKRFTDTKIDNEKMSIMLFTSGTTSLSKAVALSHKNICSNLMDLASTLDVNSEDIFLSFLPIHHVFECTVGFLLAFYVGAQTVFADGIRHIPENLKEYKASVMASVPAIYERLFKIIRKQIEKSGKLDEILANEEKYKDETMEKKKEVFKEIHEILGGNIKLFISGAANLDSKVEEKFRKLGFNMVQGYGLTETSPIVAVGNKKYHKIGSIGKPAPSVQVKLLNKNEKGIGELAVKGPNVMIGYYNNKEATKKVLKDGWFSTGDLAKIDEEGYIFICGRKKNVIVLKNGKNIYPEEMESLINKEDGIEESFIFGKPISEDPNNIKIYAKVVYNKGYFEGLTDEEIKKEINKKIAAINRTMPRYKAIRGTIISEEPLIKTTTNKIKREKNLEQIVNGDGDFDNINWNGNFNNKKTDVNIIGKKKEIYKIIDSTQLEIHRRINENKIENGLLIMADKQTQGKGTHGRVWHTDTENNIAFSFYYETECICKKLEGITIEIAETIQEVFQKIYNIKLQIKTPNDIVYNGKKIGGILTETKVNGTNTKYMVVGIGINTNQTKFNKDIENIASSIKNEFNIEVNNMDIINEFCKEFEQKIIEKIGG